MWYEIIPTAVIIMAGIGVPQYATQWVYNLVTNNIVYRQQTTALAHYLFHRDSALTNNPWAAGDEGLKGIPDD